MGFGIKTAFDARFVSGFELVSAWLGLEEKILKSDVVLSGEGRFDASSLDGKGPALLLEMLDDGFLKKNIPATSSTAATVPLIIIGIFEVDG